MNTLKQIRVGMISQSRQLWKVLIFIYMPVFFLFLLVGLLSRVLDTITLSQLMRHVVTTGDLPFFSGLVPQLEGVLWSASLAAVAIAWIVLQRRQGNFAGPMRFLLQAGIVTTVLLLDDLFLFHGDLAPKYLHVEKYIVLSIYLVMIGGLLFSNRVEIISSEYLILFLALGLFGTSTLMDLLPLRMLLAPEFVVQTGFFLEDGFKFAGIATWLAYFGRYAVQQIESMAGVGSDTG